MRRVLEGASSPIGLTGVYVWSLTCFPILSVSSVPLGTPSTVSLADKVAMLLAVAALFCLVAGVAMQRFRPSAAVPFGVWGFLGCACGAWLFRPAVVEITQTDPLRGLFASVGLCLYALAWGVPRVLARPTPEADPRAHVTAPVLRLAPHRSPSRSATLIVAMGVASCLAMIAIAWRIREPTRALVAHGFSGLVAVCFLSTTGFVAVRRLPSNRRAIKDRLRYVLGISLALLGLLVAGVIVDAWLHR